MFGWLFCKRRYTVPVQTVKEEEEGEFELYHLSKAEINFWVFTTTLLLHEEERRRDALFGTDNARRRVLLLKKYPNGIPLQLPSSSLTPER